MRWLIVVGHKYMQGWDKSGCRHCEFHSLPADSQIRVDYLHFPLDSYQLVLYQSLGRENPACYRALFKHLKVEKHAEIMVLCHQYATHPDEGSLYGSTVEDLTQLRQHYQNLRFSLISGNYQMVYRICDAITDVDDHCDINAEKLPAWEEVVHSRHEIQRPLLIKINIFDHHVQQRIRMINARFDIPKDTDAAEIQQRLAYQLERVNKVLIPLIHDILQTAECRDSAELFRDISGILKLLETCAAVLEKSQQDLIDRELDQMYQLLITSGQELVGLFEEMRNICRNYLLKLLAAGRTEIPDTSEIIRVLVIDDDRELANLLSEKFSFIATATLDVRAVQFDAREDARGYIQKSLNTIESFDPHIVLLDIYFPVKPRKNTSENEMFGFSILEAIDRKMKDRHLPVVIFSGLESIFLTQTLNRPGTLSIHKPETLEDYRWLAKCIIGLIPETESEFKFVVGESAGMAQVIDTVRRIRDYDYPLTVLIQGETGTGKTGIAEAIHSSGKSQRKVGPFVTINCAAIPEDLLESILFGYVKGAFTNADTNRLGLISKASGYEIEEVSKDKKTSVKYRRYVKNSRVAEKLIQKTYGMNNFRHQTRSETVQYTLDKSHNDLSTELLLSRHYYYPGTIFLDEIGDMPKGVQVKILRLLEEQVITPVGANFDLPVDVRIIAGTHRNLEDRVLEGEFRDDLFYRLNIIKIILPPLRNRIEDIPSLWARFAYEFAQELRKEISLTLDRETRKKLEQHDWPGNIREFRNCLLRAVALTQDKTIGPEIITFNAAEPEKQLISDSQVFDWIAKLCESKGFSYVFDTLLKKRTITHVLEKTGKNQNDVAALLNTSAPTVSKYLDKKNTAKKKKR